MARCVTEQAQHEQDKGEDVKRLEIRFAGTPDGILVALPAPVADAPGYPMNNPAPAATAARIGRT